MVFSASFNFGQINADPPLSNSVPNFTFSENNLNSSTFQITDNAESPPKNYTFSVYYPNSISLITPNQPNTVFTSAQGSGKSTLYTDSNGNYISYKYVPTYFNLFATQNLITDLGVPNTTISTQVAYGTSPAAAQTPAANIPTSLQTPSTQAYVSKASSPANIVYVGPVITPNGENYATFALGYLSPSSVVTSNFNGSLEPEPSTTSINTFAVSPGQFGGQNGSKVKSNISSPSNYYNIAGLQTYITSNGYAVDTIFVPYADASNNIQVGAFNIAFISPYSIWTYITDEMYNARIPNSNLAYIGYMAVFAYNCKSNSDINFGTNTTFTFPSSCFAQNVKLAVYDSQNTANSNGSLGGSGFSYDPDFRCQNWVNNEVTGSGTPNYPLNASTFTINEKQFYFAGWVGLSYASQYSGNSDNQKWSTGHYNYQTTFTSGSLIAFTYNSAVNQSKFMNQLPSGCE